MPLPFPPPATLSHRHSCPCRRLSSRRSSAPVPCPSPCPGLPSSLPSPRISSPLVARHENIGRSTISSSHHQSSPQIGPAVAILLTIVALKGFGGGGLSLAAFLVASPSALLSRLRPWRHCPLQPDAGLPGRGERKEAGRGTTEGKERRKSDKTAVGGEEEEGGSPGPISDLSASVSLSELRAPEVLRLSDERRFECCRQTGTSLRLQPVTMLTAMRKIQKTAGGYTCRTVPCR